MAIHNVTLPPINGYVEVEYGTGRAYKSIDTGKIYLPSDEIPRRRTITELTEENEKLRSENKTLKAQITAITDRADFVDDCIAEMASVVYAE